MKYKFNDIYNIVLEGTDTKRKSMQKIAAMQPRDFARFLKELLPYIKNGELDLKDVRITEKIDGSAIAMIYTNNDLFFESSYSGVTTYDKVPFNEAAEFLYKIYKDDFKRIANKYGDFKIKGELIYIDQLEETGKVTPVAASYLANKFGEHGGIVIFELMKIENNELVSFDEKIAQQIFVEIKKLTRKEFAFYIADDIIFNKRIKFTLDIDRLIKFINNPVFDKARFTKSDESVLTELKLIQQDITQQLLDILDKSQGTFSEKGDLIEGIVFKINSTGNQYGLFSKNYKDLKEKYWHNNHMIEAAAKDFFYELTGYKKASAIKNHWNELDLDTCKQKYNNAYLKQLAIYNKEIKDLQTRSNVPNDTRRLIMKMTVKKYNALVLLNTFEKFQEYIFRFDDNDTVEA